MPLIEKVPLSRVIQFNGTKLFTRLVSLLGFCALLAASACGLANPFSSAYGNALGAIPGKLIIGKANLARSVQVYAVQNGVVSPEAIFETPDLYQAAAAISPNGRHVLGGNTLFDVDQNTHYKIDEHGSDKFYEFFRGFSGNAAAFSPDSRYLGYVVSDNHLSRDLVLIDLPALSSNKTLAESKTVIYAPKRSTYSNCGTLSKSVSTPIWLDNETMLVAHADEGQGFPNSVACDIGSAGELSQFSILTIRCIYPSMIC